MCQFHCVCTVYIMYVVAQCHCVYSMLYMCYLYKHKRNILEFKMKHVKWRKFICPMCCLPNRFLALPRQSLSQCASVWAFVCVCTMVRVWFFAELPNRWTRWWLFLIFVALVQYHCHMMTMQFNDMCLSHWIADVVRSFVFHFGLSIQWLHVCFYKFITSRIRTFWRFFYIHFTTQLGIECNNTQHCRQPPHRFDWSAD